MLARLLCARPRGQAGKQQYAMMQAASKLSISPLFNSIWYGEFKKSQREVTHTFVNPVIQLDNFIDDMRKDDKFNGLNNLGELSTKTNKHVLYDFLYLLLKLVLIFMVVKTKSIFCIE